MSRHTLSETSRIVALAAVCAIVSAAVAQARGVQPGIVVDTPPAAASTVATTPKSGFAVVDATGKLVRGRNALSARLLFPGLYAVIFNSNVRSCAYIATLADPGSSTRGRSARSARLGS